MSRHLAKPKITKLNKKAITSTLTNRRHNNDHRIFFGIVNLNALDNWTNKTRLSKMSRHRAGPHTTKSESTLNNFYKVMLSWLMFNYNYCSYFDIKNLWRKNLQYLIEEEEKLCYARISPKRKAKIHKDTIFKF